MKYKDWIMNAGNYGDMESYSDSNAIVIAIKNILLSKPGNYPFNPSLGVNIEKYQFDLLDDQTISNIKNEISFQIGKYVQSLERVTVSVDKITEGNDTYLGISVRANTGENDLTANFLILREAEELKIYNEIF